MCAPPGGGADRETAGLGGEKEAHKCYDFSRVKYETRQREQFPSQLFFDYVLQFNFSGGTSSALKRQHEGEWEDARRTIQIFIPVLQYMSLHSFSAFARFFVPTFFRLLASFRRRRIPRARAPSTSFVFSFCPSFYTFTASHHFLFT